MNDWVKANFLYTKKILYAYFNNRSGMSSNFSFYKLSLLNFFKKFQKIDYNELFLQTLLCEYAKSLQSCPTLCDPIDSSPPGCPVPGILQARTLEWVAISFSNA